MNKLALYVHYPFCLKKCPYCDFNSHVSEQIDHQQFSKAYSKEISYFAERLADYQISSIFFVHDESFRKI